MPRKTLTPPQSTDSAPLALSELHIRLQFLEKEHQSLLKQIKRKRTELSNFIEQMSYLKVEINKRAIPLFQKLIDLDQEIHTLFDEIFTTRKLGQQTLKNIQTIYRNLQLTGTITPKINSQQLDTELDELFGSQETEEDFPRDTTSPPYEHWQAQPPVESSSGGRTESSKKIRSLFLRLAEIFHPDKVTDSETQKYHTEIMKEINKAYQEGDLARLLEIEQRVRVGEVLDDNNENDLMRKCRNLEQQNQILLNQYQNLKRELTMTKKSPEGTIVTDSRKAAKKGIDTLDLMAETINYQINIVSQIRDFVKSFRLEEITIKEFLAGPLIS